MKRAPIEELESLEDSTYYYWIGRIGKLYQLCIWAAWRKAKRENVAITLESIFGESGFAGYIYRDTRSDKMEVAFSVPGDHYELYGQLYNWRKSTADITSGDQLDSGVEMTGIAVDKVLNAKLGDDTLRELLRYLPFFGKFKGEALPFNENGSFKHREEHIAKLKGNSGKNTQSLRDRLRTRHKFLIDDSEVARIEIAKALNNKAVRAAVIALENRDAVVPQNSRPQKPLPLSKPNQK